MDKEVVLFIFAGVGTVTWGVIGWTVIRIVARADVHAKRIGANETTLTKLETLIPTMNEAANTRHFNLNDKLERMEEMLSEGAKDHKLLDAKFTTYLIETARSDRKILEQILSNVTK